MIVNPFSSKRADAKNKNILYFYLTFRYLYAIIKSEKYAFEWRDIMNIHALITALVDYAIRVELAPQEERAYMTNMLLTTLGLSEYEQPVEPVPELPLEEILGQMCDYAYEKGLIDSNTVVYRDLYDTALMNAVTPRPGEVIRTFRDLYKQNPEAATDYFYKLSRDCNYIRMDRIDKNLCW
jgi:UDPglucose--hexose-1-phosphate uridylyltransferase